MFADGPISIARGTPPGSPWLRMVRLFASVARRHPDRLWTLFWNTPLMIIALHFAVFGQAVGVLFGAGDVALKFTDFELGMLNHR